MSLKIIYFTSIILLTVGICAIYFYKNSEHNHELDKIKELEKIEKEKNNKLEEIRKKSKPCPVSGLNTPRSCYFDSEYRCSWNAEAERCDKK